MAVNICVPNTLNSS